MTRIDTRGKRHADVYPKPPWLRHITGEAADRRSLSVSDWPLHSYTAVMRHAVDGDTIEVDTVLREGERNGLGRHIVTERVRLLGYNAPERNQEGGTEATAALNDLIPAGSTVYVHTYYDRRSFNRVLAWCFIDEGDAQLVDVAAAMIGMGHGVEA